MRNLLTISLLLLTLTAPSLARAQTMLETEVNKGKRVTLSAAAASVVAANPEIADVQVVSPRVLYIYGKKVGETSIFAVDAKDKTIFDATVSVTHDLSNLERTVKRMVPDADVSFKSVDGGIVMEGHASTISESEHLASIASTFIDSTKEKMINLVQTNGSDQVMLKVKIVEMSRRDLKRLGVNLQNVTVNGEFGFQLLQGNDILFHTADPSVLAYGTPQNVLARTNTSDVNALFKYKDLYTLVNALETDGLAHVLAEPSLTTTSGKAASFLAGGQFPLPVKDQNNAVTIEYKDFGVSLNFTPVVMAKDHLSITVAPEVSTLNFSNPIQVEGITYPILNTRKASAVVELGSGQTFMMAGLLQSEVSNNINKFPGLGDVPVLGALFRSQEFQNNQTELVILVTPYVVHAMSNNKQQTPIDGFVPPSDLERVLWGNLYKQQPLKLEGMPSAPVSSVPVTAPLAADTGKSVADKPSELAPLPRLHGPGGFIIE